MGVPRVNPFAFAGAGCECCPPGAGHRSVKRVPVSSEVRLLFLLAVRRTLNSTAARAGTSCVAAERCRADAADEDAVGVHPHQLGGGATLLSLPPALLAKIFALAAEQRSTRAAPRAVARTAPAGMDRMGSRMSKLGIDGGSFGMDEAPV